VPGVLALAFSCAAPSGVPSVMAAGAAHDTFGVVTGPVTTSVVETLAVV